MASITLPCITLIEPYASLVVSGVKTIETRTGPVLSRTRGPLLIAVSKKPEAALDRWAPPKPSPPEGWPSDLRGQVIGVVNVVAVGRPEKGVGWIDTLTGADLPGPWRTIDDLIARHNCMRAEACFGQLGGRWLAWLDQAAWLREPVPVRGLPGRYPVTLPASVVPNWAHPTWAHPTQTQLFGGDL